MKAKNGLYSIYSYTLWTIIIYLSLFIISIFSDMYSCLILLVMIAIALEKGVYAILKAIIPVVLLFIFYYISAPHEGKIFNIAGYSFFYDTFNDSTLFAMRMLVVISINILLSGFIMANMSVIACLIVEISGISALRYIFSNKHEKKPLPRSITIANMLGYIDDIYVSVRNSSGEGCHIVGRLLNYRLLIGIMLFILARHVVLVLFN